MRFALFGATGQTGSAFLRQELVKKWMCNLNVNMSVYLGHNLIYRILDL